MRIGASGVDINRQLVLTPDSADPIPPPRVSPATPVRVTTPERTARPKAWASASRAASARPPALVPAYLCLGLPRGAAELGQLQDHYHQNDDDQDPDDDADNSSVHFASSIRVLTRNFRSGR